MSTELQKLAQKENYGLFTVRGMKGNAIHFINANVKSHLISELYSLLDKIEADIKETQELRAQQNALTRDYGDPE